MIEKCTPVTTTTEAMEGGTEAPSDNTESNATTTSVLECRTVPHTYDVSKKVRRDPKPYDMSMWLRRCPRDVKSCFKAQGNWDDQKPVFRGCAGAKYAHGKKCKRE